MLLEYQPDGRPTFDHYFIGLAGWTAVRGDCLRSQVGAVLVLADNHTIYIGYNGTTPGQPGCLEGYCPRGLKTYEEVASYSDYSDCIGIHAEVNAIKCCLKRNSSPTGAKIYITRPPCNDCIEMLKSQAVAKAFWAVGDGHYDYLDLTPPKM